VLTLFLIYLCVAAWLVFLCGLTGRDGLFITSILWPLALVYLLGAAIHGRFGR
jgi:hypothetical protein